MSEFKRYKEFYTEGWTDAHFKAASMYIYREMFRGRNFLVVSSSFRIAKNVLAEVYRLLKLAQEYESNINIEFHKFTDRYVVQLNDTNSIVVGGPLGNADQYRGRRLDEELVLVGTESMPPEQLDKIKEMFTLASTNVVDS